MAIKNKILINKWSGMINMSIPREIEYHDHLSYTEIMKLYIFLVGVDYSIST